MDDLTAPSTPSHVPRDRVFEFDMYADKGLATKSLERYPELLRDLPEVFWTPCNNGHWVVTGMAAIKQVLHAHDTFGNFTDSIPHPPDRSQKPAFIPIQLDPPEHTIYRNLINPILGPKAVNELAGEIRELCVELIGKVADKGGCEFIDAVSLPLPVLIFMRQMGLPRERYKELSDWAHASMNGGTLGVRRDAFRKIYVFLGELLEERERDPQPDWISRLLFTEIDGKRLDRVETVLPMCMILFTGGLDTVKNMLGHFMRILASRPDLQKRLREDPSIFPDAIEELLRIVGGTNVPRVLRKDTVFRGVPMREDELVLLVLPTIGIDPAVTDRPNELDFDRDQKAHLSFGAGPHRCAGSNLARIEIKIFFEEWFSRIPEFRIKGGTKPRFTPGIVPGIDDLQLVW